MPVTARLSKAFYDRFGEAIVTELVEWFNLVDATYRADLRDLNELNFARFDAKLEQRMSQLEAKMEVKVAQLESRLTAVLEQGFSKQTRFLYVSFVAQIALILAALTR